MLKETLIGDIQIDRISKRLDLLAQIGGSPERGITRLAFTEEDSQARDLVANWMREAGLTVSSSPIGNIIGRLEGAEPSAKVVMAGSHIDTVYSAGRFDGTLGTIAALEAIQVISESHAKLRHPLETVCFMMEESARFGVGYAFGSKVMIGQPISDEALLARDRTGKTLARAIYETRQREVGNLPKMGGTRQLVSFAQSLIGESRYPVKRIKAFVELHIEQGPILEARGVSVGAVTAIAAPTRLRVTLTGVQNHSGTTPMALRHDALATAAEIILAVERIAKATDDVVGTVGIIEAEPNSMTAIPGRVRITIDLRSTNGESKMKANRAIQEEIQRITNWREVEYQIDVLTDELPQPLAEHIAQLIEENSLRLGITSMRLPSGAGHDAAQLAKVVPETGMIFVPSRSGISHNPQEWINESEILKGTQVLLSTLLDLAE
ncbi:MAG TPA: Zn-dependent hydrolase [Ktedonobacterales bacterium]|jgi:hydantoinase/carbamoylase family amidase